MSRKIRISTFRKKMSAHLRPFLIDRFCGCTIHDYLTIRSWFSWLDRPGQIDWLDQFDRPVWSNWLVKKWPRGKNFTVQLCHCLHSKHCSSRNFYYNLYLIKNCYKIYMNLVVLVVVNAPRVHLKGEDITLLTLVWAQAGNIWLL